MTAVEQKSVNKLVEHELALKVYLDSLLFETPAPEQQTVAATDVKGGEPLPQIEVAQTEAVAPQSLAPEWAEREFESLLFKVAGGLTLSVPLHRLNGIVPWPGRLTAVPGYAEWFLGLMPQRGRQVRVIDLARFVIPEHHKARGTIESGERHFRHILLIDDNRYGLACDDLGSVIKLVQSQVRWRSDRTLRPWLAGTVIDQMCALLDIERFVAMLKDGVPADDIREDD